MDSTVKYWDYYPGVMKNESYGDLLNEIKPHLTQGVVKLRGEHEERRLTTLFAPDVRVMKYSGRTLTSIALEKDGILKRLLHHVNKVYPSDAEYNAIFVNWYRPVDVTPDGKADCLGWHSDDTKELLCERILSMSFCENDGVRVFRFRDRSKTKGHDWQCDIGHGDILVMNPGCQDNYKHCVPNLKKTLSGKSIEGGRINLTFRSLK
ncbi:Alpha-ketoglutarate-dependent repair dioxygenase AlkB [uncultured virus]|nr:Alpha-ketoglutarate-dependent repair dioxygenase AlkB [uncultured virus]